MKLWIFAEDLCVSEQELKLTPHIAAAKQAVMQYIIAHSEEKRHSNDLGEYWIINVKSLKQYERLYETINSIAWNNYAVITPLIRGLEMWFIKVGL